MATQHILACIDGSAVTESICGYAAWYANRLSLPVALLNTIEVPASVRRDLSGTIGVDSRQILLQELSEIDERRAKVANNYSAALVNDAKSYINSHFDVAVDIYQRHSKLLPAIEHFSDMNRAIVMGRRGEDHKNSRINIGSQIETVARASNVPILICSEPFQEPSSYMIAFDASKTAIKVIKRIAKSEVLKKLPGHLVMVGNHDSTSKNSLSAAAAELLNAGYSIDCHHLPQGDAVNGLLNFQLEHHIDIMVIGAYGHSKWQQMFLGSTTTEILASTVSPVILVR
ncbi:MAG: universal stress protein [Psychrobacter sp.]|jgi:nucleotide-binding universal stress UspA family protein|uniref:universal stress protein n=1 Tax=Psychrobacter TaxID=497 RepID=UPI00191ADE2F|nr:universal stress protein [Psychrobacter sp. Ps3]MCG3882206.1 universal stress protein [Psychrobacter sp. Ps3]|tara:strand:+ start:1996 stop:2853 length:858 start_codon:yes stop_codon:yes gene_type:complete